MKKQPLYLDFYDADEGTRWSWKKGLFASQEFKSERAARSALAKGRVIFSSLDDEDILGALEATAEVNDGVQL
jgi:hypothetical protein